MGFDRIHSVEVVGNMETANYAIREMLGAGGDSSKGDAPST